MAIYGHFDNQELGNAETDVNFLNGIITAFQFINHKTDLSFDFSLKGYEKKSDDLQDALKLIYHTDSEMKLSKMVSLE